MSRDNDAARRLLELMHDRILGIGPQKDSTVVVLRGQDLRTVEFLMDLVEDDERAG